MALTVRDMMTENPFTLESTASLSDLYDLMDSKNVRHVPVVDAEGNLEGLATHRDLLRGALHNEGELPISTLRHLLRSFTVDEVMTHDPETVSSDTDIGQAGALMMENKFGCLPVVDGDRLVGILTESDFVRYVVDTTQ